MDKLTDWLTEAEARYEKVKNPAIKIPKDLSRAMGKVFSKLDEEDKDTLNYMIAMAKAAACNDLPKALSIIRKAVELEDTVRKAHGLDQQTHGLSFGVSRENCAVCKALASFQKAVE